MRVTELRPASMPDLDLNLDQAQPASYPRKSQSLGPPSIFLEPSLLRPVPSLSISSMLCMHIDSTYNTIRTEILVLVLVTALASTSAVTPCKGTATPHHPSSSSEPPLSPIHPSDLLHLLPLAARLEQYGGQREQHGDQAVASA